jgi:hypothetical protein
MKNTNIHKVESARNFLIPLPAVNITSNKAEIKPGMVAPTCNPITWETKQGHSEFKDSLGYITKLCLCAALVV